MAVCLRVETLCAKFSRPLLERHEEQTLWGGNYKPRFNKNNPVIGKFVTYVIIISLRQHLRGWVRFKIPSRACKTRTDFFTHLKTTALELFLPFVWWHELQLQSVTPACASLSRNNRKKAPPENLTVNILLFQSRQSGCSSSAIWVLLKLNFKLMTLKKKLVCFILIYTCTILFIVQHHPNFIYIHTHTKTHKQFSKIKKPHQLITAKVTLEWNWSENIYHEPQNHRCILIISMALFYSDLLQANLY